MLHSISWTEFLTTLIAAAAIYYIAVLLIYYRTEITGLAVRKKSTDSTPTPPANSLMGKVRPQEQPPAAEQISTEEIKFQTPAPELNTTQLNPDSLLIGAIADLLEDIKTMADVVQGTPREEVIPLFKSLLTRYPIIGSNYRQAISLHLYTILADHGFNIDAAEPATWWPHTNETN